MQMTHIAKTRWLSCILCVVLLAAMALTVIGCNNSPNPADGTTAVTETNALTESAALTGTAAAEDTAEGVGTADDPILRGQGATVFSFTVTFADGKDKVYEIHTDKTKVGEALQELGLIDGEEGAYGLYVKVVDGETADYDVDGTYWAFYVNGEYGMTGVDVTDITPGASYAFKIQK